MEVSITEYAKTKGVTRQTIYNWIRAGKLQTKDCCGIKKIYVGDNGNVEGGADIPHAGIEGTQPPKQG